MSSEFFAELQVLEFYLFERHEHLLNIGMCLKQTGNKYFQLYNNIITSINILFETIISVINLDFKRKIRTWIGIRTSDLQITSLALLPIELSKFPFQSLFK